MENPLDDNRRVKIGLIKAPAKRNAQAKYKQFKSTKTLPHLKPIKNNGRKPKLAIQVHDENEKQTETQLNTGFQYEDVVSQKNPGPSEKTIITEQENKMKNDPYGTQENGKPVDVSSKQIYGGSYDQQPLKIVFENEYLDQNPHGSNDPNLNLGYFFGQNDYDSWQSNIISFT